MKTIKFIIFAIATLILSIITFFTFNLVFSAVSNYQSVSKVLLSLFPMFFFMCILITLMVSAYYYFLKERRDVYFFRQYSLTVAVLSLLGVVFSILSGTYVYGSFFKDYIFDAYPFIMLVMHSVLFVVSSYYAYRCIRIIVKEKPEVLFKGSFLYFVRMASLVLMYTYALEKLGAFVLTPIFYSDIDGYVVIPYIIQSLIPALIMTTYVIHEDFLRNRKVTLILSSIAFGYSLFSMIYMIVISHGTYPLTINPTSPINQLERLVTFPVSFILMYGFSLLISFLNGLNNTLMMIKEKKTK